MRRGFGAVASKIALLTALGAALSASAQHMVEFEASNGKVLRAPQVEALSCDDIGGVLDAIDALEYRDIGPRAPTDPRDIQIFEYEVAISRVAFYDCDRTRPTVGSTPAAEPR